MSIKLLGLLFICLFSTTINAQKETKKEIRKEVRMEEKDGEKVLTIITDDNGTITEEVYTGDEADAMLEKMMEGNASDEGISKEVEVEIIDGEKTVTITTTENGKVRKEVYTGEDADLKLKELQEAAPEMNKETKTNKKRENVKIEDK